MYKSTIEDTWDLHNALILGVCYKGERVEGCITFLDVRLNLTGVLHFTYKNMFMLDYIKIVSKSVKNGYV